MPDERSTASVAQSVERWPARAEAAGSSPAGRSSRPPLLFVVPKDTTPEPCRWCGKFVYWITTVRGKRMPVDTRVDGGLVPLPDRDGRGVSHFATCPFAPKHRRSRSARSQVATVRPPLSTRSEREQRHCDRK